MTDVTEPTYALSEEEAQTAARALGYFAKYLGDEFNKIGTAGTEISDLIKEAARRQYQELVTPVTRLHTTLAETFPKLRQP